MFLPPIVAVNVVFLPISKVTLVIIIEALILPNTLTVVFTGVAALYLASPR